MTDQQIINNLINNIMRSITALPAGDIARGKILGKCEIIEKMKVNYENEDEYIGIVAAGLQTWLDGNGATFAKQLIKGGLSA